MEKVNRNASASFSERFPFIYDPLQKVVKLVFHLAQKAFTFLKAFFFAKNERSLPLLEKSKKVEMPKKFTFEGMLLTTIIEQACNQTYLPKELKDPEGQKWEKKYFEDFIAFIRSQNPQTLGDQGFFLKNRVEIKANLLQEDFFTVDRYQELSLTNQKSLKDFYYLLEIQKMIEWGKSDKKESPKIEVPPTVQKMEDFYAWRKTLFTKSRVEEAAFKGYVFLEEES